MTAYFLQQAGVHVTDPRMYVLSPHTLAHAGMMSVRLPLPQNHVFQSILHRQSPTRPGNPLHHTTPHHSKKLVSLAAEKLVSEVVHDTTTYARMKEQVRGLALRACAPGVDIEVGLIAPGVPGLLCQSVCLSVGRSD